MQKETWGKLVTGISLMALLISLVLIASIPYGMVIVMSVFLVLLIVVFVFMMHAVQVNDDKS